MRVILYTGKGGVGKTTVAAATALRSAELGYKTIILSTDTAHSLSDSFSITLGGHPQPIAPSLWGQETNILREIESHWGAIREWLAALMMWRGVDEIVADEMAVLPGMEELANLLYIVDYHNKGEYDVIIVDCAPTGETLRLLSFPEMARWYMERVFPIERRAAGIIRPVMKHLTNMPMPGDEVLDSIQNLFTQLSEIRSLLTNPDKCSVRLVLNPEIMVIKESQRLFTYLNLYGYSSDLVICNRVIPDRVKDRYFDSWKESQSKYYHEIEECFAPLPILIAPLLEQEVRGVPMLRLMAKALYGDEDPTRVFFRGQPSDIRREDGHYILTLPLPFTSKQDISLLRNGDELVVRVGNIKRNIILPRTLADLEVKEAKFEGERLKIRFEGKTD